MNLLIALLICVLSTPVDNGSKFYDGYEDNPVSATTTDGFVIVASEQPMLSQPGRDFQLQPSIQFSGCSATQLGTLP